MYRGGKNEARDFERHLKLPVDLRKKPLLSFIWSIFGDHLGLAIQFVFLNMIDSRNRSMWRWSWRFTGTRPKGECYLVCYQRTSWHTCWGIVNWPFQKKNAKHTGITWRLTTMSKPGWARLIEIFRIGRCGHWVYMETRPQCSWSLIHMTKSLEWRWTYHCGDQRQFVHPDGFYFV